MLRCNRRNSVTKWPHLVRMVLTTSCRISSLVRLGVPKLVLEVVVGLLSVCVCASGESASRNRDFRGRRRMSGVRSKFFSATCCVRIPSSSSCSVSFSESESYVPKEQHKTLPSCRSREHSCNFICVVRN